MAEFPSGTKTAVTEIVTGLGALGLDLSTALRRDPPEQLVNVPLATWDALRRAFVDGRFDDEFTESWDNGRAFLLAREGLRGRLPIRVEWKGPDRQPGHDPVPADLRIDSVFLVSIKSRSDTLRNSSPNGMFGLSQGHGGNWYLLTAPDEYQALYDAAKQATGVTALPATVADLSAAVGRTLGEMLPPRAWPPGLQPLYRAMADAVSESSVRLWNQALRTPQAREQAAWWLIRLAPAPYFLLGAARRDPLRIKVDTHWDWRQRWRFDWLDLKASDAGQPQVDWSFEVTDRRTGEKRRATGYIELRWSHRKFAGAPEGKVKVRRHEDVPGYVPLDEGSSPASPLSGP